MKKIKNHYFSYRRYAQILVCCLLTAITARAADPVAFSNEALVGPTVVDMGDLSEDATYVFFFNALKGGASTALAGNDAFGLKLEQWNETGFFGVTEFGVMDHVFEPDGSGEPESIFEEDVHAAFVNDFANEEVRLYLNGQLSGYYDGNFELFGEVKVMAARVVAEADAMGSGSILYSWATYDEALAQEEISELAANAKPTTPAEPEDPATVIASSTFVSDSPTDVDFGRLSGDATYVFYMNLTKGGASTAIAGNDSVAIKLDQWNEQGVFGLTLFGVADYVFEPLGDSSVASIFAQDVHVAIVNDTSIQQTKLYLDGVLSGVIDAIFDLAGPGKILAARIEEDTDPAGDGSILYSWATYNAILPEDKIAEMAEAAQPFDPTGPFTEPTAIDMGVVDGDASYEFFFKAIKQGASTAIAGNDQWGLKLEQWPDTLQFGLTQFGVADHLFELEGNGSEATVFDEDVHAVFINDVTNGEVRLHVNGEYVGYILTNFALSGATKIMAARIDQNTDPMGEGSVFYYWAVHPSALSESEILDLYAAAEPRQPINPPTVPETPDTPETPEDPPVIPDGAIAEPTVVDFGEIFDDATYEFAFRAVKKGASTAIAGNDQWGLKLDQWNEQGVFGLTEFGVLDHVFQEEGPGSIASVFEEDVHVIFVNDFSKGEVRLYVNGLYAGFIETNFDFFGEGKVMAARISQDTDPMGDGSVMYMWAVHEGVLTDEQITEKAAAFTPPTGAGSITGITQSVGGSITIEFTGKLEAASTITGIFTPVDGAISPYTVAPTEAVMFYIAR